LDVFHKLKKIEGGAAQAVRQENGRRSGAFFQLHQGREARRGGLLQNGRERGDRGSAINRDRFKFAAADARDFREQLNGVQGIAAKIEEIVLGVDSRALQHVLPDRSERFGHR